MYSAACSRVRATPLHVQVREDELFYVLEGQITVWLHGELAGEPAGEFDLGAVGTVPPDMDRMAAAAAAADVEILGPPPFETDV